MKNRVILSLVAGGAVFLLLLTSFSGTVSASVEIDSYPTFSSGDYFNYDVNATGFARSMEERFRDANIEIESSVAEIKVAGYDKVTDDSHTYDCVVMEMSIDIKMRVRGSYDGENYSGEIHQIISDRMWQTRSDAKMLKDESSSHEYTNMTMLSIGKTTSQESKDISYTFYDNPVEEYKIPVKSGEKWSTTTGERIHLISMKRVGTGKWQAYERNYTSTVTKDYEVLSEQSIDVKAGSFDTLKIKESKNGSENCTYEYVTSKGMVVKLDMKSGNETIMTAELSSYRLSDSDSKSTSAPGPLASILALSLVMIAYAYRKNR